MLSKLPTLVFTVINASTTPSRRFSNVGVSSFQECLAIYLGVATMAMKSAFEWTLFIFLLLLISLGDICSKTSSLHRSMILIVRSRRKIFCGIYRSFQSDKARLDADRELPLDSLHRWIFCMRNTSPYDLLCMIGSNSHHNQHTLRLL
jgi:hypothetical protein